MGVTKLQDIETNGLPSTEIDKPYNILSIDGGGMRTVISTVVIDHMETEAYNYASNRWLQSDEAKGFKATGKKILMHELF